MPDLPSSTPDMDKKMFDYVLGSDDLQADQWKIYPCQTTPWTRIEKWFKSGKYVPFTPEQLMDVMVYAKTRVHPWIRLNRVIRDIPEHYIQAGNPVTNLRQEILQVIKDRGQVCKCIRCREVGRHKDDTRGAVLKQREYVSSGGREIFVSFETEDEEIIFGFVRLRLSANAGLNGTFPELTHSALVRELHVYGQVRLVEDKDNKDKSDTQHIGFGKRLMRKAEEIAHSHGYRKVAVIAGIGTRGYYAKIGYKLEGTYMVKELETPTSFYITCGRPRWFSLMCFLLLLCTINEYNFFNVRNLLVWDYYQYAATHIFRWKFWCGLFTSSWLVFTILFCIQVK